MSLLAAASWAQAEVLVYKVDPVHSGVNFKVRHFLNQVPGAFQNFTGEIHFDKDHPEKSKVVGEIQVASVDTRNSDRDAHLQNEDFFNAPKNPTITFESTKWEQDDDDKDEFKVTGNLTMAGVTKQVTLDLEYLGEMEGRNGQMVSGWEAETKIKRSDWGITYGSGMVGDEVEIELNIQAKRGGEK
ncbi:MAG: YceI family protein [Verrucomicrobiota bacterium JB022]|nr:YceI family protein [Verrucomicrobiota bacterium JB022]